MAINVKFLKGTAAQYAALASKDVNTFYYTTDDSKLYLGTIELSTPAGVQAAIELVNHATKGNEALKTAIDTLNGDVSTAGSMAKAIDDKCKAVLGNNADLTALTTTAKTIIAAINELDAAIDNLHTDAAITVSAEDSEDYAKVYKIYQGEVTAANLKGTINIPKDMVVESGEVVTNPAGKPAGTYIKLVLANADNTELFINVTDLIDIYTPALGATQVQLAISGNEISASLVAGGVGTTELANSAVTTIKIADDAVTTAKILDLNVTKDKLAQAVQDSLDLADSALQAADITTGTTNGTINVDGTEVAVAGLGSAAYTASTAYATSAQGDLADSAVQSVVEGDNNGQIKVDGTPVNVHGLGTAAYTATTAYDAAGSATTAEQNAKSYTDSALTWNSIA